MEKQPEVEKLPNIIERTPELELAWRGLVYSIESGKVTRKRAIEMLHEWGGAPLQPDIIEVDE